MKTIDNLNIAPERVLNDEELIQLKGGKKQYNIVCKNGDTILGQWTYDSCTAAYNKTHCQDLGGSFHTCA